MGLGDEILASGHAERVFREGDGRRVAICDHLGTPRWHDLWDGNPILATPEDVRRGEPVLRIRNAKFCRPYVRYPFTRETGWRWTGWRARDHVGRIYLTARDRIAGREARRRGPFVLIEPHIKPQATRNKDWGFERYAALVRACPEIRFVQAVYAADGRPPVRALPGACPVPTQTFRDVLGLLEAADAYLGAEGALHHAAAALGKPAVVLFGGAVSVETLGYPSHVSLADTGPGSPCGRFLPCAHCRDAMAGIRVGDVAAAVHRVVPPYFL